LTGLGVLLIASVASPAAAVDPEYLTTLPEAHRQTLAANLTHQLSVADDAAAADNTSCRLEQPAFVVQPEIDHRVTVKGEDTAVTNAACVDLNLVNGPDIIVFMFLEYWDGDSWEPIRDEFEQPYTSTCRLPRINGAGDLPCFIDAVLEANHEATDKLHRVGAALKSPKDWPPIYTENPLSLGSSAIALSDPCDFVDICGLP
jgi:hypothetical protein